MEKEKIKIIVIAVIVVAVVVVAYFNLTGDNREVVDLNTPVEEVVEKAIEAIE